jgi:hypothetical protein
MLVRQVQSDADGKSKTRLSNKQRKRLINLFGMLPVSLGRTQYLRYLHGDKLTSREAIKAKCLGCLIEHEDEPGDCKTPACPLYPFKLMGNYR